MLRVLLSSIALTFCGVFFNGLAAEENPQDVAMEEAAAPEISTVSLPSTSSYVSGSWENRNATLDCHLELRKGLVFEKTHTTGYVGKDHQGVKYEVNFITDTSTRFMSDDDKLFQVGTFMMILKNDVSNQCILWEAQEMKEFKDDKGCITKSKITFKGKIPSKRSIKIDRPYSCFCDQDYSQQNVSFYFE